MTIQLNTGTSLAANVLVGYQTIPTDAANVAAGQSSVTLNNTQAGEYDIVIEGDDLAGLGTSFTLTAQELPFAITSVSPGTSELLGPSQASVPAVDQIP